MPRAAATAVLIAGAVALGFLGCVGGGVGAQTTAHAQDVLWPSGVLDPSVAVVAIDDESIAEIGEWPWPRRIQAELVNALVLHGARVIGYDVLLPGEADGSARLIEAMSTVPTVVAEGFSSAIRSDRGLLTVSGAVEPDTGIREATAARGHTVVTADSDGVTRTVPLIVDVPGADFAGSLALRTVDLIDGSIDPIYVRPGMVQAGGIAVPVEDGAGFRVRWSGGFASNGPRVVSAADVLDGTADPDVLDGAVVFVGATALALGDRHLTPLQPGVSTAGVVVQAEVAATILSSEWVLPVDPWWSALVVLVVGFGLSVAALTLRLRWVAASTFAALALYLGAAVVVFGTLGLLADTVRVPLSLLASVVVAVAVRLLVEQRERRRAVELFTRYVPERVAEHLLRTGRAQEAAEGERVSVGLMFCDLRGFTPLAASLPPPRVREILDRYYDYVCERIFANGGTVMQFVGDEVFAVFGAPDPIEDVAASARATGLALQRESIVLATALASAGLPSVSFGVSVHIGEVVAAHVGPPHRRQYAVIGDPVNVASRLCGTARAGDVVISAAAAEADRDDSLESVELRGVTGRVHIVRVEARGEGTPAAN